MDVRDMSGRARSGRRLRRGPEPSRGGGTRGRIIRSADGDVEACRRKCWCRGLCCGLAVGEDGDERERERASGGCGVVVKKRRIVEWRMLVGRDDVELDEEEEVSTLEAARIEEALLRIVGGQRGMLCEKGGWPGVLLLEAPRWEVLESHEM